MKQLTQIEISEGKRLAFALREQLKPCQIGWIYRKGKWKLTVYTQSVTEKGALEVYKAILDTFHRLIPQPYLNWTDICAAEDCPQIREEMGARIKGNLEEGYSYSIRAKSGYIEAAYIYHLDT